MKPLLMPRWDAHSSSTGAADLSKHLEKGPKPCSCLIFIFPRVPVVLKARLRAGSSPGTATSQIAPAAGDRMAPAAPRWSMGWRSSGATSQLCPLTAWLQTSPCSVSRAGLFSQTVPAFSRCDKHHLFIAPSFHHL